MTKLEDDFIDYMIHGDEFEGMHDMNKYCPVCGGLMLTKEGIYGKFRGCSNFPKCDWTEDFEEFGEIVTDLNEISEDD